MNARPIVRAALLLALAAVAALPARAGAWTQKRGALYSKLSFNHLVADREYDADGNLRDFQLEGEFTDSNLAYYGEYGLGDRLALFGTLPVKSIHYENLFEQGSTSGAADVDVGLRYRLRGGPVVLSVQGLAKLPAGYAGRDRLPLGNDQIDGEVRLLVGQSLARSGRAYYGLEAGYRYRAEAPSDEWRYLVELGGRLSRPLYARAKLDGSASARNADDIRDVFGNPVATLEADLGRLELTLGYEVSRHWSAEAAYTPTLYGASTAKSEAFSLGLVHIR